MGHDRYTMEQVCLRLRICQADFVLPADVALRFSHSARQFHRLVNYDRAKGDWV